MGENTARKSNRAIWILAGIYVAIMGVAAFLPKLGLGPTGGSSPTTSIVNSLRQLDGAMETWALEKGVTNVMAVPGWNDLLPYLAHKPASVGGELYVPGRLCEGPHAILTRKYLKYPKGTIIQLRKDGTLEFEEPKKIPLFAKPAAPSRRGASAGM
jgi:hypothetical protein